MDKLEFNPPKINQSDIQPITQVNFLHFFLLLFFLFSNQKKLNLNIQVNLMGLTNAAL